MNSHAKDFKKILKTVEPKGENLIAILHRIQDEEEYNYIPEKALNEVAEYFGMTPSEVYGVISFYSMLSVNPRGKYIVRVCTSAPCYVMGSTTVIDILRVVLGVEVGETTVDKMFTLEVSSCLGLCDGAPAMMINGTVYKNLTFEKIEKIVGRIR